MKARRVCMCLLVAVSCMGQALAAQAPRQGARDARIASVPYRQNDVLEIRAGHGVSTMLIFGEDERFETIALGDTESWQVVPAERGNVLFVKPLAADVTTNMHVVTTRRFYFIELRDAPPQEGGTIFAIRYLYPDKKDERELQRLAEQRAAHPSIAGMNRARLNIDYTYSGDETLAPAMVFDDGRKTFFRFEGVSPAIFAVNADHSETLRNTRKEGELIVVDGVADQFTLRDGRRWTCVFNRARGLTAASRSKGIGPGLERRAVRRPWSNNP